MDLLARLPESEGVITLTKLEVMEGLLKSVAGSGREEAIRGTVCEYERV